MRMEKKREWGKKEVVLLEEAGTVGNLLYLSDWSGTGS